MAFLIFLLMPLLVVLTGCAAITDNTHQLILITTPDVIGAECILTTPENRYRVITPDQVLVQRSKYDLEIECRKAGYAAVLTKIESGNYVGRSATLNVVDGVIPGTAYDIASDAIYRYPTKITIDMHRLLPSRKQ